MDQSGEPQAAEPRYAGRRFLIAGSTGLVGSALCRQLRAQGAEVVGWSSRDGDLRDPAAAREMAGDGRFDAAFLLAATQGGVADNLARPAAFLEDNALIAIHVLRACSEAGVRRLVYAGSTAVYPEDAEQPYREEQIGAGRLEHSHGAYALAKLVGVNLCAAYSGLADRNYTAAILTNIYGPGGTFDEKRSTVAAALVRRMVEAARRGDRELEVWGTGEALRDLMFVDDATAALIRIAEREDAPGNINVCSGREATIREIAEAIARAASFEGQLAFNADKPEGARRRVADPSRLRALGFEPSTSLEQGLAALVADYCERYPSS